METALTKHLKEKIHNFTSILKNSARPVRFADEVFTGSGYVDSIRFEEYLLNENNHIYCGAVEAGVSPNLETCRKCKTRNCSGCIWRRVNKDSQYGICVTCYEMKISVADFLSEHGHNFVGNYNYYVVPIDIYNSIEDKVPDGVGVIVYYKDSDSLRIAKKSKWNDIDEKYLTFLLYNALGKWCRGSK